MRLVREINRRVRDSVAEFSRSRRVQRGKICGRTAADEKSAGCFGKTAEPAKPINDVQLDRRGGRAAEPGSVENIEAGSKRVRHRADEIAWARNEGEKAWVIDVEIVWKNVFLQSRQELVRFGGRFGG